MIRYYIFAMISMIALPLFGQEAQQPSIMVMPSDNLLKRLGYLSMKEIQGRQTPIRDYQSALINEADLKFIISGIKESFAARGFPLEDLETTLKNIQTEAAYDIMEDYDFDPKAMILKAARPDIVLDLTYELRNNGMTNQFIFNIEANDAYSHKGISSASDPGIETTSTNVPKLMKEQLEKNMNNLQQLLMQHFQDLREKGREVTLRLKIEKGAISSFKRERCGTGKPYNRWIKDWLNKNTKNGYGKRVINTDKELYYTQIRIPLYDDSGYPISASDWAEKLLDDLEVDCNIIALDNSNGLGEAIIVFINN